MDNISNKRFPIKADSNTYAYMLPRDRVKGSIPWEDAIPVVERWHRRYHKPGETFEQGMTRLAEKGGLDHQKMDAFSSEHHDPQSAKNLPLLQWRKNFIGDTTEERITSKQQFHPQSLSEYVLFSTVKIQTFGQYLNGLATGFLFRVGIDGQEKRFVVTNKHVFQEAKSAILSFHVRTDSFGPAGQVFNYQLEDLSKIINHSDSEIDLCVLPFELVEDAAWAEGINLFSTFIESNMIPSDETLNLMPLTQEIYMFGYPIGLWDTFNQLPIIRRGSLASHPALDYCGKPYGAVDIAAFPGSSGSPVFVLSDGGPISDKRGNVWANRPVAVFLGILTAGAQIKPDGSLDMIAIPVQSAPAGKGGMIPIHLGYYIKSEEVEKFARWT